MSKAIVGIGVVAEEFWKAAIKEGVDRLKGLIKLKSVGDVDVVESLDGIALVKEVAKLVYAARALYGKEVVNFAIEAEEKSPHDYISNE